MSYTDNNTTAKEILNDYVQWALGHFWTQQGIDQDKIVIDHISDPSEQIDKNVIRYLKNSGTILYMIPAKYNNASLFTGLKLDAIVVGESENFYTGTITEMRNTKLDFMTGPTTCYVIGDSEYHLTNQIGKFISLDKNNNIYKLFQIVITNAEDQDYIDDLKQISADNKSLYFNTNMKALKRCCVDSQLLGTEISTNFCTPFLSDIFGLPSYPCDQAASNFCNDNPKDPTCACFSDDPAAIGTGYDTLIHRFMNGDATQPGNNPTQIARKCILNACKNSNAYKTAKMRRYDCPHLCTSLLNTNTSDTGSIDIKDAIVTVRCGDGKQNYTLGSGPGPDSNGDSDSKTIKWWGYLLIVLSVLIVIGGIIFVVKNRNKKTSV